MTREEAVSIIEERVLVTEYVESSYVDCVDIEALKMAIEALRQPEIIRCKDCVKHNKGHGYYLDGTVIGIKDCCPLVEIRGIAQGHEFDYQYCAYAERRTDGADVNT